MKNVLVNESKYTGRYVAVKDFQDDTVISDAETPQEAYEKALERGFGDPVILFVPYKNMVQIY